MTSSDSALQKTSHSEVESFVKCERNHYYGYGLGIRSAMESDALVRGQVGHAALARYYQGLKDGEEYDIRVNEAIKVVQAQLATYETFDRDKLALELAVLLEQYFNYYREADELMEVLEVEKEFLIPVGDQFFIKMYVDLVVRMPGYGIAVWDHKFVYDFYNQGDLDLNPQLPKYVGALVADGWVIGGAFYNELRYRLTKGNTDDPSQRFERIQLDISPARVANTMKEQIQAARRIKYLRNLDSLELWEDHVLRAANPMICRSCSFKELCAADLNDRDTTLAIEYNYKKKESRDPNG